MALIVSRRNFSQPMDNAIDAVWALIRGNHSNAKAAALSDLNAIDEFERRHNQIVDGLAHLTALPPAVGQLGVQIQGVHVLRVGPYAGYYVAVLGGDDVAAIFVDERQSIKWAAVWQQLSRHLSGGSRP